jgi:hypothetical protein
MRVGVFMGLAGDGGFQIHVGAADGQAGGRVAHFLQVVEMAMLTTSGSRTRRPWGDGFPRRNGDVEPLDVFNATALIANKMMMTVEVGVEARGLPFPRPLAN